MWRCAVPSIEKQVAVALIAALVLSLIGEARPTNASRIQPHPSQYISSPFVSDVPADGGLSAEVSVGGGRFRGQLFSRPEYFFTIDPSGSFSIEFSVSIAQPDISLDFSAFACGPNLPGSTPIKTITGAAAVVEMTADNLQLSDRLTVFCSANGTVQYADPLQSPAPFLVWANITVEPDLRWAGSSGSASQACVTVDRYVRPMVRELADGEAIQFQASGASLVKDTSVTDDSGTMCASVIVDSSAFGSLPTKDISVVAAHAKLPNRTIVVKTSYAKIREIVNVQVSVKDALSGQWIAKGVEDGLGQGDLVRIVVDPVAFPRRVVLQFGEGTSATMQTFSEPVLLQVGGGSATVVRDFSLFGVIKETAQDAQDNPTTYAQWIVENLVIDAVTGGAGRAYKWGAVTVKVAEQVFEYGWNKFTQSIGPDEVRNSAVDIGLVRDKERVEVWMDNNGQLSVRNYGGAGGLVANGQPGGTTSLMFRETAETSLVNGVPTIGLPSPSNVADAIPPEIAITPNGLAELDTRTPLVTIVATDTLAGTDPSSLDVRINGIQRSDLFKVSGNLFGKVTFRGKIPAGANLRTGPNVIEITITDKVGNTARQETILTVAATVRQPAPIPPTVFAANGSAIVLWDTAPGGTVSGYRLYRSINGGAFSAIGNQAAARSFVDNGLPAGASVSYQLTVIDIDGTESEPSAAYQTKVTAAASGKPAAPIGLNSTPSRRAIDLAWQPVPGAVAYLVTMAISQSGPFEPVSTAGFTQGTSASISGLSDTLPRWFQVVAIGKNLEYSTPTSVSAAAASVAPGPPGGLSVLSRGDSVVLRWDPASDAGVAGYVIWRINRDGQTIRLNQTPIAGTSFVDYPGFATFSSYAVSSIDAAGVESARTATRAVTTTRFPGMSLFVPAAR